MPYFDLKDVESAINRSLPFVRLEQYTDVPRVSLCLQWFDREVVKTFGIQDMGTKERAITTAMAALPKMLVALGEEMQQRAKGDNAG